MRWPWETKKPVHDPTRNHDIYTIHNNDSWTFPVLPSFTFPDNFWCQILSIRISIETVAGIRGAASTLNLALTSNNRSIIQIPSILKIVSSTTNYLHWAPTGSLPSIGVASTYATFQLPDFLYAFPNDILTITTAALLNGDISCRLSIRIKRWEFY